MINLFDEMSKVLDKVVKHYKSDFEIDKQILLKNQKKYFWLLRECGTDLYDAEFITIKESEECGAAEYYLTQSRVEAVYEVTAKQVDGDTVLGELKRIPLKKFENIVFSAKRADESDKLKLLKNFTLRNIWLESELDILKNSLKRRMESYGIPFHIIKEMLERKKVEDVKYMIEHCQPEELRYY